MEADKVVPDEITHLDFEPEPEIKCGGYSIKRGNDDVNPERDVMRDCPNAPKIAAVRSCCGIIDYYCLSCYTKICDFHSLVRSEGRRGVHRDAQEGWSHAVDGKPFSQVEFL